MLQDRQFGQYAWIGFTTLIEQLIDSHEMGHLVTAIPARFRVLFDPGFVFGRPIFERVAGQGRFAKIALINVRTTLNEFHDADPFQERRRMTDPRVAHPQPRRSSHQRSSSSIPTCIDPATPAGGSMSFISLLVSVSQPFAKFASQFAQGFVHIGPSRRLTAFQVDRDIGVIHLMVLP